MEDFVHIQGSIEKAGESEFRVAKEAEGLIKFGGFAMMLTRNKENC